MFFVKKFSFRGTYFFWRICSNLSGSQQKFGTIY